MSRCEDTLESGFAWGMSHISPVLVDPSKHILRWEVRISSPAYIRSTPFRCTWILRKHQLQRQRRPKSFESELFRTDKYVSICAITNWSEIGSDICVIRRTVSTPVVYRPRSCPAVPLPGPLSPKVMGVDSFYDDEDWMSSQTVAKAKSNRYDSVVMKVRLPRLLFSFFDESSE